MISRKGSVSKISKDKAEQDEVVLKKPDTNSKLQDNDTAKSKNETADKESLTI